MTTIASLNVNLGMNTASFSAQSKKAKQDFKEMEAGFAAGTVAGGLNIVAEGLSTVGAEALNVARNFAEMVKETNDQIDATADLSQQLGVDIEKLTRLQYVATLTGSEVDALTDSIRRMSRMLGDQGRTSVFDKLGVDVKRLKRLDPADAFLEVSAAIRQLPTQADKAAAAYDVFGRKGIELLNTINADSDAVRQLWGESDRLRFTLTAIDVEKIGQVNEALDRTRAVLQGIKNNIAIELAPVVTGLVYQLGEVGNAATSQADAINEMLAPLADPLARLHELIDLRKTGETALAHFAPGFAVTGQPALDVLLDFQQGLIEKSAAAAAVINTAAANQNDWTDAMAETHEAAAKLIDKLQSEVNTFGLSGIDKELRELDLAGGIAAEQASQLADLITRLEEMRRLAKERQELEAFASQIVAESISPLDRYLDTVEQINKVRERGLISAIEKTEALARAEKSYQEAITVKMPDRERTPFENRIAELMNSRDELGIKTQTQLDNRIAEIQKEFEAGRLKLDEASLLSLDAQRQLLESQEAAIGPSRPAALERGTAAAFSASFGADNKPVDKVAKITEQMLNVLRRIEAKEGLSTVTIGP